jgi:transcriptional repressor NrdR
VTGPGIGGRYRGAVRCPHCQASDDKVVDSRPADEGSAIRRRRECVACGRRFTTYERLEELSLVVVKRSGAKEPFERIKLEAGIERAVTGRPIAEVAVASLASEIEEEMRAAGAEVASERIGLAVLERLQAIDPVSYLRFASVYKGFEDVTDFEREVAVLQKTTEPKGRPARAR